MERAEGEIPADKFGSSGSRGPEEQSFQQATPGGESLEELLHHQIEEVVRRFPSPLDAPFPSRIEVSDTVTPEDVAGILEQWPYVWAAFERDRILRDNANSPGVQNAEDMS